MPRDAIASVDAGRHDGPSDARDADRPDAVNDRPDAAVDRPDAAGDRPDAASVRDAGTAACPPGSCAQPLETLLVTQPCVSSAGVNSCTVVGDRSAATILDGAVGTVYDVALRVRGVVEPNVYTGACLLSPESTVSNPWVVGGLPAEETHSAFRLYVSSPPQTFYLNGGPPTGNGTMPIDFEETVRIAAGATITLSALSPKGYQFANFGANGMPVTVGGTMVPQPYDGQFAQVDIMSAQAETLPLRQPGMALSFMGGQTATAADSDSLRPTDVTLEAWVDLTGFDPDVDSVVGKPYGTATDDSFAIWYQSSYFDGGVGLAGPDQATSYPWSPGIGEWHHTAMTYDSTSGETVFYWDGIPSACGVGYSAPPMYDGHAVFIGADTDYDGLFGFWIGAIDEVRIFSRARTPDQVWADMHTDKLGPTWGLSAEWTFDEGEGQTAADSSGNGNTATLGFTTSPELNDPSWVVSTLP